ncbi:MAG: efflux RND transporter periplasmic adaptor subunit, partial [Myxococcales bacterium]
IVAVVAAVLIIGAAVGVYFLTRGPGESPYRGAEVTRRSIIKEVRVTGHVELTDQLEVPAPIEGQLVEVVVEPGDTVEQGELLAQLDRVSVEVAFLVANAELQVANARVSETEAAAKGAARSLDRTARLAQKGLASASDLEAARSEMAKARAALDAARAERAAAVERASLKGRDRDRADIVAPRAGLILEVPPRTGMVVGPKTRMFRIGAPLDQMYVEAPIGEADIGEMSLGLTAKFEVPTYPGRVFDAKVSHINPDPKTQHGATFYTVTLTADNPDHVLLPGMTAQVRIKVAQVEDALAVREATLRFTPEGAPEAPARTRVWRIKGTKLQEIPVEAGLSDGAFTEVRPAEPDGLEVDELIAIGLAMDGDDGAGAPSLSLRGQR